MGQLNVRSDSYPLSPDPDPDPLEETSALEHSPRANSILKISPETNRRPPGQGLPNLTPKPFS